MQKTNLLFDILRRCANGLTLSHDEQYVLQLLFTSPIDNLSDVFVAADEKTKAFHGNKLYVRGVIELSNICKNTCKYCSMSSSNANLRRYIMPQQEVIDTIQYWHSVGINVFHLSSGEHDRYSLEDLIDILKVINDLGAHAILVLGSKSRNDLIEMINACKELTVIEKFETSNPWLYHEYNDKSGNLEFRLNQLSICHQLGCKIGTGNIVGLPFQTPSTLVNDLLLLRKINPTHASTSNYVRSGESTYSSFSAHGNTVNKTLLFIALMRLVLDGRTIIPTNSSLGESGKKTALRSGANLISLNLTPEKYIGDYVIYDRSTRKKASLDQASEIADKNGLELVFQF